jgi:crotonobetainyl-CoA:carnitine CoA-transferase CaiB-like acyl-CoA transferase
MSENMTEPQLPLSSVRVLAVEQYGAGPFGTMALADLGAEVIKIEDRKAGGDFARGIGPYFLSGDESEFFQSYNRNKQSLTVDLATLEGQGVFRDLVKTADVVASNLRGDVPEKLGLTYEALKDKNEKIVCAHLSAYGRTGPRAAWPGFDYLMQAEAGYFSLTGEPDGPPTRMGLSIVDQMTGLGLAYIVAAGVVGARASGTGQDLDVSLFDVALSNLSYPATWYLNEGHVQERMPRSGHPSLTPCQLYLTKDASIFIMCNKEKFWPNLCRALDRPDWIDDSRFKSFTERLENRALVQDMLDTELSKKTTAEWLMIFSGDVPAAPVLSVEEALENPFVQDHGRIMDLERDGQDPVRVVASAYRASVAPTPRRGAPKLGEHTEKILSDIGYDAAKIAALKRDGVI